MKNHVLILGCCALLAFTGCDATSEDDLLSIGVVMPFSGTLDGFGAGILIGMELARNEINSGRRIGGTRLEFITLDNQSTPEGSLSAFDKLIAENRVPVIMGPFSSSSTARVVSTADKAGVVVFSPSSSASGLGSQSGWLFRSALTVDVLVPAGIEISKNHLRYRRVATIVNDADTYSNSSHSKITEVLSEDSDITIVSAQSYSRPPGTPSGDLTSQLEAIKHAAPDIIFVSGLPEDQMGIITQANAIGLVGIRYFFTQITTADVRKINAAIEGSVEGAITIQLWHPSSDIAKSKEFIANYTAQHGIAPGDLEARGYVAMQVLEEALVTASDFRAESIKSALAGIRNLDTIFGSFSFNDVGDAVYNPIVVEIRDNEFEILN